MLLYWLPILLVILSNTLYHITAKSTPGTANPLASLLVTYLVASAVTLVLMLGNQAAHKAELFPFRGLNWTSFALGLCIVGLEYGYIMAYRAGWNISVGSLVANIVLAIILLAVGVLLFREHMTIQRGVGILLCVIGLVFINWKA